MKSTGSPRSLLWGPFNDAKKTDEEEDGSAYQNRFWGLFMQLRESLATPLMVMYFLMLMVNTLLRDTKDTLLVTSKAGVEAIPILKSWLVIPGSVMFFLFYAKLSRVVSRKQVFIIVLSCFVMFYVVFGIFLYPLKHYVGLSESTQVWLTASLPPTFGPSLVALIDEWPLALFFVVSELWSSGVCQLMFWQVANDVISVRQAKAFYPAIGAMGNLGMVVAGHFLMVFANQRDLVSATAYLRIPTNTKDAAKSEKANRDLQSKRISELSLDQHNVIFSPDSIIGRAINIGSLIDPVEQGWSQTLAGIALMTLSASVMIIMCYNSLYRRKRTYSKTMLHKNLDIGNGFVNGNSPKREDVEHGNIPKRESMKQGNTRMKLMDSMRMLFKSKPLQCVAILVISYGVSSCLVEVCWKGQVKKSYTRPNDYSRFMAQFWFWTGIVSMGFMVMGRLVLEKLGYKFAVLFTPVLMIVAGTIFFLVTFFESISQSGEVPYAAYSGGFLVMIAKSAKYAFFDSTKEMMFIPLDDESKGVGKAAIELVAYRMAKSGGSFYLQLVILLWGSVTTGFGIVPIAAAFFLVMVLWSIYAYTAALIMDSHKARNAHEF
eukprot:CAMPEP_0204827394 /NCGR_PEP_ID=MMETSP1346-20131115/4868_1 /ASSEMBLY_ACC=CAM_ASM_000771 /TAXON_ID=215587 /ORGANISM="Aplanochytrium stocchinoi, Strain GSBS06" /LENGTH=601 /DNA_ID=CAMNT_0051955803 /DNA_START=517 /DNA_END=2322 /DNA_ORIENTATION=-